MTAPRFNPPLHHPVAECIFLGIVVAACWLGAIGMVRMREPMQSLQFLALPASIGAAAMTLAVLLEEGFTQVFWKTLLVSAILFATNSVGTHASARAFRARQLGHWEPLDGDPIEFVRDDGTPEQPR
jgi:monovalent cation/proton antiporter MnhG/PhaG subunit